MRKIQMAGVILLVLCFLTVAGMISFANAARPYYTAFCDGRHGLTLGWIGPERFNYGEALTDAQVHRRHFPDHNVDVFSHD